MKTLQITQNRRDQNLLAAKPIYLDNHATTPLDPLVLKAMVPYLTDDFGNPSSNHFYGLKAKQAVENARHQTANWLGVQDQTEIIFTSGATESNNFVIKGVYDQFKNQKPHFIVSNIEHKCILEAAKHVESQGAVVDYLPVDSYGRISLDLLEKAIKPETVLVSVMAANNEIGTINDIQAIAALCHKHNVLFHSDAAQAIGKIPIDIGEMGVDFLSASAHKFYGPKGVGFLYVKKDCRQYLTPLFDGGGQEIQLRSGTLNVPAIVGLGQAIVLACQNLSLATQCYFELRNRLYKQLKEALPELKLNGPHIAEDIKGLARLPNNLNICLPNINISKLTSIYAVAFSSTSACSSGQPKASYVLKAIGRSESDALRSLRFGIGRFNNQQDIDQAANIIIKALKAEE